MNKGTCKFYNGDYHNTHCEAGVRYKDVTSDYDNLTGRAFRKPCVNWDIVKFGAPMSDGQRAHWEKRGTCDKYTEPTKDELAAYEAETEAYIKRFRLTIPLIAKLKREHDKSCAVVEKCPVCGGRLHLRLAVFFSEYQGTTEKHCHGTCETEGCLRWME